MTTWVCIRSFACEDEDTSEVFEFTEGTGYGDAARDAAHEFPENFSDLRGLLVCIHGFEFQDPDTGLPRFARYGHDFVTPDDWLARYYPENFVPVDAVVPSDGIPGLPLPDDE